MLLLGQSTPRDISVGQYIVEPQIRFPQCGATGTVNEITSGTGLTQRMGHTGGEKRVRECRFFGT